MAAIQSLGEEFRNLPNEFFVKMTLPWIKVGRSRFAQIFKLFVIEMFLVLSAWSLCTIRPWGLLHAAWLLILLELAAGAAVWWTYSHYHAAITCLCYFLFVDGLRRAFILGRGTCWPRSLRPRHLILAFSLLIPTIAIVVDLLEPPSAKAPKSPPVVSSSSMLTRSELLRFLEHQERPAIGFVS